MITEKERTAARFPAAPEVRSAGVSSRLVPFLLLVASATTIVIGSQFFSLEEEKAKLQKQLAPYDEAEQYSLVAVEDGWYPCCNCSSEKVFLHREEIWKYGSTIKKKRYTESFLKNNRVRYFVEFEGDLTACRKQEITKIRMYKFSLENQKRNINQRLIRPPGNCINN